jgi:hypothetical protein
MTPKEKAEEIYTKFVRMESHCDDAQECALIAVDEILNNFGNLTDGKQHYCAYATVQYYKEVKQEIEQL